MKRRILSALMALAMVAGLMSRLFCSGCRRR